MLAVRMADTSPYNGLEAADWRRKTEELVASYPVAGEEIVEIVLDEWDSIFESRVGRHGLRIGEHIRPKPQIMGDYLHELIPFEFQERFPGVWRRDQTGVDKDLVNLEADYFSTEIKTSSHANQVFGNRKKSKSGFFLTVNFQKWSDVSNDNLPRIRLIRLGWLDHTDWIAQAAASGQQARIRPDAYAGKLIELYRF
jgi:hypothetical protein